MYRDERYQRAKDHVKISHFTEKGHDIHGVVHVGTNDWYELQWYIQMGISNVLGFEPLQMAYQAALKKYQGILVEDNIGPYKLYDIGLGEENAVMEINVASGDGQSSSVFELLPERAKDHQNELPIRKEPIFIHSFIDFINDYQDIHLPDYDCLVVDVEGMELQVLMGMGEYLRNFSFLNIELSGVPRFVGGPTAQEIVDYLDAAGFRQDSPIEDCNDVMFIRKDL